MRLKVMGFMLILTASLAACIPATTPPVPAANVASQLESATEAYNRSDFGTALRLFRPLAEQGNAEAQFYLGVMYNRGEGVAEDPVAALGWISKAADQGHAKSQLALGMNYCILSSAVPHDLVECLKWLYISRANGNRDAQSFIDTNSIWATQYQIDQAQRLAGEWRPKRDR